MPVAHESRVAVVGQGYVGLPLAVRAVEVGHTVVGFDLDKDRVDQLRRGVSFIDDITDADLALVLESRRYTPSDDPTDLAGFTIAVVCVPTPLRDGAPDLSYIEGAARLLAPHLRRGVCVVLESTTYPGTTEEVFVPVLEAGSGLRAGADFHVGYSPERIDPSNSTWGLQNTPKIVSGIDDASAAAVTAFYESVVDRTVPAPGTREAELAKLLENTFRHVNIALVNELAIYCHELGLDVWSVIELAASKPFGFMRFTPRPRRRGALPADRPVVPVVAGPPGSRQDLPVRRDRQRRQRQHARIRRDPDHRAPQPPAPCGQRQPGPAGGPDLQAQLRGRAPVPRHGGRAAPDRARR